MDDVLKRIVTKFDELKGQIVIDSSSLKIKRLIAILEDSDDYYYVLWNGRKATYVSCLLGITPLKGYIPDKDYERYKYWDSINSYDQVNSFNHQEDENKIELVTKVKKDVEDYCNGSLDRYVTEICWEIN